ncbi:DNA-binding protein [Nakamurella sp. YIM 132087]|uniref:DNA-binding protein n=1 Tax=Nakamurella alba TaxID=2665158 RepID=A0A7K1FQH9_9ACTN|nr:DNA-binding protein [Nakamurella alba]MTD15044.1 DNA-binding protein [Nakamurella alba]
MSHSPVLDALDELARSGPTDPATARLLERLRRVEEASGQSIDSFLDTVQPLLPAVEQAQPLSAAQRRALASVGADPTPAPPGLRASFSTALGYERLVKDALSTREAAELLGVGDSRIRQRLRARTLLSTVVRGSHRLPRFQFTDTGELPGWAQVAPRVPVDRPLIAVEGFLTHPHVDLALGDRQVSPLEWLQAGGDPGVVADLAGE